MTENPNICGVVVTFHPAEEVEENLRAVVRECGRVLVVDNGSPPEACARLAAVPGVELLALGENRGVAAALNLGAAWALRHDCTWVVTFDQDSQPDPGLVAGLWAAHLRHPTAAIVGPCIQEQGPDDHDYRWVRRHPHWPGFFQRVKCTGADLPEVTLLVTSGSMIELAAWTALGGFAEDMFIDYVDIDYSLRVVRAGRTIAIAAAARLQHKLGARQAGRLLGRDFRPTHHAAFRHYYIARNRVTVWRRHARAVPHWALFDLGFASFNSLRVLLFEEQRRAKLKALILGTWDGLLGRGGPCPVKRQQALAS